MTEENRLSELEDAVREVCGTEPDELIQAGSRRGTLKSLTRGLIDRQRYVYDMSVKIFGETFEEAYLYGQLNTYLEAVKQFIIGVSYLTNEYSVASDEGMIDQEKMKNFKDSLSVFGILLADKVNRIRSLENRDLIQGQDPKRSYTSPVIATTPTAKQDLKDNLESSIQMIKEPNKKLRAYAWSR